MITENGKAVKMKETIVEPAGCCSSRGGHFKVLILCFLCTLVYIYLYSNLTIKTLTVNNMMKDTIDDLQRWKNKVEGWVRGFSENSEDEIIDVTETQNSTDLFVDKQESISGTYADISQSNLSVKTQTLAEKINAMREAIIRGNADPLITLFTTWPTKKDKFLVHNSTVINWRSLSPFVRPVLFTNEEELSNRVHDMGWSVLPIRKAAIGIPLLKYMYMDAMAKYKSTFYAYSNGDILYTESLVKTLVSVLNFEVNLNEPLMIVGQRTNVQDVTAEEASTFDNIRKVASRGQVFTAYAEDYFITNENYPWEDCPEVVVGRRAYDNWLVLNARKHEHITVDATKTLLAVHQTTKAGNYEGHAVPNSNYNDRLLVKMYRRVPYGAGLTSCTSFYTALSKTGEPKLVQRNIHRSCFPI